MSANDRTQQNAAHRSPRIKQALTGLLLKNSHSKWIKLRGQAKNDAVLAVR